MAKITLEPGDRIVFPTETPGYRGYGMILSDNRAFLIEVGSRMGPQMSIGPIPGGTQLLQSTLNNEVSIALSAVKLMLDSATVTQPKAVSLSNVTAGDISISNVKVGYWEK